MDNVKTSHITRRNGFFDKIRTLRFERPQRFLILKKVPFRRVIWLVLSFICLNERDKRCHKLSIELLSS